MTGFRDVLVVSDLDGTLLDHETYSWDAARPALDVLRSGGAGLVLASSKTAAEISDLRDAIQFPDWPSIVENGSGLLEPGEDPQADLGGDTSLYRTLRSAIAGLPAGFRGFGDMTEKEVSERTGLTLSAAQKARMRRFSEPGVWEADSAGFDAFIAAAKKASWPTRLPLSCRPFLGKIRAAFAEPRAQGRKAGQMPFSTYFKRYHR